MSETMKIVLFIVCVIIATGIGAFIAMTFEQIRYTAEMVEKIAKKLGIEDEDVSPQNRE